MRSGCCTIPPSLRALTVARAVRPERGFDGGARSSCHGGDFAVASTVRTTAATRARTGTRIPEAGETGFPGAFGIDGIGAAGSTPPPRSPRVAAAADGGRRGAAAAGSSAPIDGLDAGRMRRGELVARLGPPVREDREGRIARWRLERVQGRAGGGDRAPAGACALAATGERCEAGPGPAPATALGAAAPIGSGIGSEADGDGRADAVVRPVPNGTGVGFGCPSDRHGRRAGVAAQDDSRRPDPDDRAGGLRLLPARELVAVFDEAGVLVRLRVLRLE